MHGRAGPRSPSSSLDGFRPRQVGAHSSNLPSESRPLPGWGHPGNGKRRGPFGPRRRTPRGEEGSATITGALDVAVDGLLQALVAPFQIMALVQAHAAATILLFALHQIGQIAT